MNEMKSGFFFDLILSIIRLKSSSLNCLRKSEQFSMNLGKGARPFYSTWLYKKICLSDSKMLKSNLCMMNFLISSLYSRSKCIGSQSSRIQGDLSYLKCLDSSSFFYASSRDFIISSNGFSFSSSSGIASIFDSRSSIFLSVGTNVFSKFHVSFLSYLFRGLLLRHQ